MDRLPLPQPAQVTDLGDNNYDVVLEPLAPGYGVTIGNALRRVLLSSMPGAAITGVKLKFVDHEFSTIPHVKEDMIQIILNLKQLRLKSFSAEPVRVSLKKKGEGVVTAGDITKTDMVEVANPDHYICTLDSKAADFDMELIVEQGRGYVPIEAQTNRSAEAGMLAVDAIYSPVRSVFFDVSNVRVGQITNFDKLTLRVATDGTITGQEAVDIAAHILVDHFTMLFNDHGQARLAAMLPAAAEAADMPEADEAMEVSGASEDLDTLTLSNRAKNALVKNNITTVAALRALSNEEIQNIAGLGEKTITEILTVLGRE